MRAAVSIIGSMATRALLAELADDYRQATGCAVSVTSVGGVDAAKRITAGEAFDLVLLADEAVSKLAADDHVDGSSQRVFAHSRSAVALKAGGQRLPGCDAQSILTLIGAARAIGVSTGPSGTAVRAMLAHSTPSALAKLVVAAPGVPVARLLARGEVDLGFQQLSELIGQTGIDIVGTVPETMLPLTMFSMAIHRHPTDADAARKFAAWLTAPEVADALRRHGMEPPSARPHSPR